MIFFRGGWEGGGDGGKGRLESEGGGGDGGDELGWSG